MQAVKLNISGKVQGVGYRRWFEQQALKLDLKGYVKNLTNGNVEAVISGSDDAMIQLIELSHEGPEYAIVDQVQVNQLDATAQDFLNFVIRR